MSGQLRNGSATAALVLGLIGWFVFATTSRYTVLTRDLGQDVHDYPVSTLGPLLLGVLAIIFGGLGLNAVGKGATGRGRSIAGIVIGGLMIILIGFPYLIPAPA